MIEIERHEHKHRERETKRERERERDISSTHHCHLVPFRMNELLPLLPPLLQLLFLMLSLPLLFLSISFSLSLSLTLPPFLSYTLISPEAIGSAQVLGCTLHLQWGSSMRRVRPSRTQLPGCKLRFRKPNLGCEIVCGGAPVPKLS